jgi:hypothetical protein
MSAKDCYVKIAVLFFTTFPLAVLIVDVVLYSVPLIFIFLHLLYGFLMYLVVQIIVYKRRVDCNLSGIAPIHGVLYSVVGFREFTLFGFSYLVLTTATALMLLFIALRMGQSETSPQRR